MAEIRGKDPTKTHFIAVIAGNLDGSIELNGEEIEGIFATEDEAVECLRGLNEAYPSLDGYVFELRPLKHIWRGEIRVSPVAKKFTPKVTGDARWPKFDPERSTLEVAKGELEREND